MSCCVRELSAYICTCGDPSIHDWILVALVLLWFRFSIKRVVMPINCIVISINMKYGIYAYLMQPVYGVKDQSHAIISQDILPALYRFVPK